MRYKKIYVNESDIKNSNEVDLETMISIIRSKIDKINQRIHSLKNLEVQLKLMKESKLKKNWLSKSGWK